jgi:hypothetical protein
MTKLTTHITDTQFLAQLCEIGLLVIFEGLLSCHGDENGMIEDMMVATEDLSQVVFKIKCTQDIITYYDSNKYRFNKFSISKIQYRYAENT